ncbi:SIRPG protein, partial [Halcyon senegalensis]|nr:SIRPG protein [Halcyon senegalensis]
VSPSVRVVADSQSSIKLNATVNLSCHVDEFYPGDVAVIWLERRVEIKVKNSSRPQEMPGGLFKLTSQVEVQATEEKNGSEFTCRVLHSGQDPISAKTTLWISVPAKEGSSDCLLSNPGLWLGILLEKGLLGGLLLFLFYRLRT